MVDAGHGCGLWFSKKWLIWWPGSPKLRNDVSCCVAVPGRTPPFCEFCMSVVLMPDVFTFTSLPLYVSLLVWVSNFMWPVYSPTCVSLLAWVWPICAAVCLTTCLNLLHPQQIKHILSVQGAEQSLSFHLPQPCSFPDVVAQVPQNPWVRFSFLLFLN